MALGTNYKRNADKEAAKISDRMRQATAMAYELVDLTGCDYVKALGLASDVVLGRIDVEQAVIAARLKP